MPIHMKTPKEISINDEIWKSGHNDPIQHPATHTFGRDTLSFPQFHE